MHFCLYNSPLHAFYLSVLFILGHLMLASWYFVMSHSVKKGWEMSVNHIQFPLLYLLLANINFRINGRYAEIVPKYHKHLKVVIITHGNTRIYNFILGKLCCKQSYKDKSYRNFYFLTSEVLLTAWNSKVPDFALQDLSLFLYVQSFPINWLNFLVKNTISINIFLFVVESSFFLYRRFFDFIEH